MTQNNTKPIVPSGWEILVHNTSADRWNIDEVGQDFITHKPLSCVTNKERLWDKTSGSSYGKNENAFQIRILFFDNLIRRHTPENNQLKSQLDNDTLNEIKKYYSFQGWRHPAVPNNTRLIKIAETDYDEEYDIHKPVYWYVPEKYIDIYRECCNKEKNKQLSKGIKLLKDKQSEKVDVKKQQYER